MAYDFNGSSDTLELSSALVSAAPFTLFARFIPDTIAAGTGTIVSVSGSAGTHSHQLRRSGSNVEAFSGEGATVGVATSLGGLIAGGSFAAAAVFSASNSRTIYSGAGGSVTDTTSVTPTSLDRTNIGARYNAGSLGGFFDGKIGEVAVWDAAITSDDFQCLFNGASPIVVKPASLIAYFPLIRPASDVKASRSLSVTGATVTDHMRVRRPATAI